jgi:alginate O-acetyltransferase complex protein AlgI
VIVGWVLFRADTFPQALAFLAQMFRLAPPSPTAPGFWELVNHQQLVFAALGCIASTPIARALLARFVTDRRRDVPRRALPARRFGTLADVSFAMALIALCAVYVASGTYNPFLYFRF